MTNLYDCYKKEGRKFIYQFSTNGLKQALYYCALNCGNWKIETPKGSTINIKINYEQLV